LFLVNCLYEAGGDRTVSNSLNVVLDDALEEQSGEDLAFTVRYSSNKFLSARPEYFQKDSDNKQHLVLSDVDVIRGTITVSF
jgi:hypothetical protein